MLTEVSLPLTVDLTPIREYNMEKISYVSPEIEIVFFEEDDILTASGIIVTPMVPLGKKNIW